jgi:hypothetical protein
MKCRSCEAGVPEARYLSCGKGIVDPWGRGERALRSADAAMETSKLRNRVFGGRRESESDGGKKGEK